MLLRSILRSSAHLRSIAPTTTNDRRTQAQESILSEEVTDDKGSIIQSSAHLRSIAPLTAIDRTRGPYVNFMSFIIIFKCLLGLRTLYFVSLSLSHYFIRFRVLGGIYVIF